MIAKSSVFLGLILCFVAGFAGAATPAAWTERVGKDSNGKTCVVRLQMEYSTRLSMDIEFADYKFFGILVDSKDSGGAHLDAMMVHDRERIYRRFIGAAITIGNAGLLKIGGSTDLNTNNGQMSRVEIRAKGGILNWWSGRFTCSDLR